MTGVSMLTLVLALSTQPWDLKIVITQLNLSYKMFYISIYERYTLDQDTIKFGHTIYIL
jgi:hypothetical protein